MRYVSVTEVDAVTKIPCTVEPMRTGPAMPFLKGLQILWTNESTWPVSIVNGVYETAPLYYGTCDDDADLSVDGLISGHSEAGFNQLKHDEFHARRHYASWIFNEETLLYDPPIPYPTDGRRYYWDEPTVSWIEYPE